MNKTAYFWILLLLGTIGLKSTTFTVASDQTFSLDGDYFLMGNSAVFGNYCAMSFASSTGATRNVTLNGQGHAVWCSSDTTLATIVKTGSDTLNLTITNCNLYNFDPFLTQSNSAGLVIKLGTGCQIIYTADHTLATEGPSGSTVTNTTAQVTGQAVINCLGNRLTIPSLGTGFFDLTNTGTLIIKNGILDMQSPGLAGSSGSPLGGILRLQSLKIFNNTSSGALNWDYQSATNYVSTQIADNVEVCGRNTTNTATLYSLNINSGLIFTINANSTLKINPGTNLVYAPTVTGDGTNTSATKRHLALTNYSSILFLNGCTVTSSTTGLAIDRGTLVIDGSVNFNTSTSMGTPASFELGSAVNLELQPAATLSLSGAVEYNTTTP